MAKASKAVVSWSAEQLLGLLRAKHEKDVFVTECKTGPSWATARPTASRLDAWALKRSWTPVETIGYEIKVDRRDFQADKKWGEYLRYCHKFFFVSPAGLVQPAEIPAGVGLLWTAGEHRLVTKVPAARREPEAAAAAELMVYVLMSRVRVVADMWEANGVHPVDMPRGAARAEQIRRWVAQAEEHGRLAEFVGGHVRRRVEEAAERLKQAQIIEKEIATFERLLTERGLAWDDGAKRWSWSYTLLHRVEEQAGMLANYAPLAAEAKQLATRLMQMVHDLEESGRKHGN